jgi:hypothetical protein
VPCARRVSVDSNGLAVCGGPRLGMVARPPGATVTSTTLLPFRPEAMTPAQLAAVSCVVRYTGHTHTLYGYQLRRSFTWCERWG